MKKEREKMKNGKLSLEQIAIEWIELRGQKMALEKRLEELKNILEPALEEKPNCSMEIDGWKFALVKSEREFFKLKEAKENLDNRILRPYIFTSKYNTIRTTWRGGEALQAA